MSRVRASGGGGSTVAESGVLIKKISNKADRLGGRARFGFVLKDNGSWI